MFEIILVLAIFLFCGYGIGVAIGSVLYVIFIILKSIFFLIFPRFSSEKE